jgi:pimeloyl-ACP methyl ester carboxylesterase
MSEVNHLRTDVDGIKVSYREAGQRSAPVLLLPRGYPCSSFEFRNLIPLLVSDAAQALKGIRCIFFERLRVRQSGCLQI